MVTDTAFFRNPNYHLPSDTIDTLDFMFMAELVKSLELALLELPPAPTTSSYVRQAFGLVRQHAIDLLANTGPKTNMSWRNMANFLIIGASHGIGLAVRAALHVAHSVRALARSATGIPIRCKPH